MQGRCLMRSPDHEVLAAIFTRTARCRIRGDLSFQSCPQGIGAGLGIYDLSFLDFQFPTTVCREVPRMGLLDLDCFRESTGTVEAVDVVAVG